jgi:hypothetical protein
MSANGCQKAVPAGVPGPDTPPMVARAGPPRILTSKELK